MKKITLLMLAVIILISCKKQTSTELENPQNLKLENSVSLQDGRLVFTSEQSYDNYLQSTNNKNLIESDIQKSGFISFMEARNELAQNALQRNTKGECEIPKELIENNRKFFQLLNKDGIIQIGDFIFRYDYCNDGAWVISKTNFLNKTNYNNFMSGTLSAGIVGFFPSDVDAFEALEMGYTTMPEAGSDGYKNLKEEAFSPSGIFSSTGWENFYINNEVDGSVMMDGKLSYDKFAFYFNFYGKEKYQTSCSTGWCTSSSGDRTWKVDYYYRCRRKGLSYDYTGTGVLQPPLGGENKLEKTFYDGSRGLRNGNASWRVYDVRSNYRLVSRSYQAGWFYVAPAENYMSYILTKNFDFPQGEFVFNIGW